MKDTSDIFGRIDALMKKRGKMEKDLISHLGLAKGTYSQWRIGNAHSYLSYIKEICIYLNVMPNELYFGEDARQTGESIPYTEEERGLISRYRELGLQEREYLNGILDVLNKGEKA